MSRIFPNIWSQLKDWRIEDWRRWLCIMRWSSEHVMLNIVVDVKFANLQQALYAIFESLQLVLLDVNHWTLCNILPSSALQVTLHYLQHSPSTITPMFWHSTRPKHFEKTFYWAEQFCFIPQSAFRMKVYKVYFLAVTDPFSLSLCKACLRCTLYYQLYPLLSLF